MHHQQTSSISRLTAFALGLACLAAPVALPANGQAVDVNAVSRAATPMDHRLLDVGRRVAALAGRTLDGGTWSIDHEGETRATVLAMTSIDCPVSRRYLPVLARLAREYSDQGVRFVFVNSSEAEDAADIRKVVREAGLEGPYVLDADRRLAGMLAARTTAEVFVLDAARTLVYRGAIDDQYGIGIALDQPRQRWLIEAVEATLNRRQPRIRATTVAGCAIETPAAHDPEGVKPGEISNDAALRSSHTYHDRISRIVADNCVECHRSGGVAPFALETYAQVRSRSAMIQYVLEEHLMPPWFAAPSADHHASPWLNDRSLSEADRSDLLRWLASEDKPEGDAADAPLQRVFADDWTIGTPDAVYEIFDAIAVKAEGVMNYIHVRVPTNLTEDRWVQALEVLPTAREVVHHVLVFCVPSTVRGERVFDSIDETRGFFAAYVPGNSAAVFPDGFARRIPAGSDLIFQLHYTPNGRATSDQTRLGVVFASKPPQREIRVAGIADRRLSIPAHAADHQEGATLNVPWDVRLVAFMPHMHVRGKAFRYELVAADGQTATTILDVPRYDFNWQLRYELREPMLVEAGSQIKVTAWFDNSSENPANPDPDASVRWGPQTSDEMLIGYVEYYVENEQDHRDAPADLAAADRFDQLLRLFDRNNDGVIDRSEVNDRLARQFQRLDRNSDGRITRDEMR